MFKDISSVTLAFVYVNVLGYVFHSVVSRSLGPSGYGEFMVLYSFMLTIGNITTLFATVSIKTIVENFAKRYEFLRSLRLVGFMIGAFFAISAFALSSYLRVFLHVTEYYYFYIIAFAWLGMFMLAVEKSFLQATGKFPLFAFSSALELTLRLIIALGVILAGLKVGGILFSSVMGIFMVLFFLLSKNNEIWGKKAGLSIKKILKTALYVSPSGFFVYADDIFIRRIFDEHTAGLFASVSIVGKVLVWFSLTILGVYFPKFVESRKTMKLKKFAFQMFGIVLLAEIGSQVIVFLVGKPLFLLLFGTKFEPALQFLHQYLLAVVPLLLSMLFISIATAVEKGSYVIYIHLFLFYSCFILLSFKSIYDYLMYIFLLNLFFVFIYLYIFRKEIIYSKPST